MSQAPQELQRLLKVAEAELENIEIRLLETVGADESSQLVEKAVDLTARVLELKNAMALYPVDNNSPSAR
jgi:hypothetical protein